MVAGLHGGQIESAAAQVRAASHRGQDRARGLRTLEPRGRQEEAARAGEKKENAPVYFCSFASARSRKKASWSRRSSKKARSFSGSWSAGTRFLSFCRRSSTSRMRSTLEVSTKFLIWLRVTRRLYGWRKSLDLRQSTNAHPAMPCARNRATLLRH